MVRTPAPAPTHLKWIKFGLWLCVSAVIWTTHAQAAPPEPHHRHATLDARVGMGVIEGRQFDVLAMYLGVSTFYFGLGFYEESTARKHQDEMLIEGLRLTGIRSRRTLQLPSCLGPRYTEPPVATLTFG